MSFTENINTIVAENRNGLLGIHPRWKRVPLKDIATILNGYPFESSRFKRDKGTPLIRIRDITQGSTETYYDGDFAPEFLVRRGEILIGMDGDFYCEPWQGEPALLNQRVCKVTPDELQYSKQFLRYALPGYLDAIHALTSSVTVKHLSSRTIADIPLPFPTLEEQKKIVAEIEKQFTRLDAGIAALKRVQANLKRYRAAVLKFACEGKFVPTEAELAKQEKRKYETGAQLLARILDEPRKKWNGRGQYNEPAAPCTANLSQLPEGWVWTNIGQVADVGTGATPKRGKVEFYSGGKIPWITSSSVNKPFVKESEQFVTPRALELCNLTRYPSGTILLAMYGEGKTRGMVAELCMEATTNQALAAIQAPHFIKSFIKIVLVKNYEDIRKSASGGVQPNLNLSIVRMIPCPLPPLIEQKRIVVEVERYFSIIEELEKVVEVNLQRAVRLRQSILQQAFSGELTVQAAVGTNSVVKASHNRISGRPNRHFARSLLSAEIVHQLYPEPTFGRIKHQKIFHLCEHIAQIEEIEGAYHREAAGPLDNKLIYANEKELKKQKWYEEFARDSYGHAYRPLPKAGGHQKYLQRYWAGKLPIIQKLIKLMRSWTTDRCEIFSTTYAAWNDLILWGKEPTEDAILHEVWDRWHTRKKRFTQDVWRKAIGWIKKEGFVPNGFGKATSTDPSSGAGLSKKLNADQWGTRPI